jgi:D-glycero-D-manno-heptose 1,7-bisphosphate phosphatase
MILQAASEFNIDLASSVLLGDNETDVQAGKAAGVGRNLLFRREVVANPSSIDSITVVPDFATVSQILAATITED